MSFVCDDCVCRYCRRVFAIPRVQLLVEFLGHEAECAGATRATLAERLAIDSVVADLFTFHDGFEDVASEVLPGLFVGGTNASSHPSTAGCAVVCCAKELEASRREGVLAMGERDEDEAPVVARAVAEAAPFVGSGRALIYCALGRSRSVACCVAIMMTRENMTLLEAMQRIRRARPSAYPNRGFWKQLMKMEMELFGKCTIPEEALQLHEDAFDAVE